MSAILRLPEASCVMNMPLLLNHLFCLLCHPEKAGKKEIFLAIIHIVRWYVFATYLHPPNTTPHHTTQHNTSQHNTSLHNTHELYVLYHVVSRRYGLGPRLNTTPT